MELLQTKIPTLQHVPKACRTEFSRAVEAALERIIANPGSAHAWFLLLAIPKWILTKPKRGGWEHRGQTSKIVKDSLQCLANPSNHMALWDEACKLNVKAGVVRGQTRKFRGKASSVMLRTGDSPKPPRPLRPLASPNPPPPSSSIFKTFTTLPKSPSFPRSQHLLQLQFQKRKLLLLCIVFRKEQHLAPLRSVPPISRRQHFSQDLHKPLVQVPP
jgi:hypothetical protein